MRERRLVIVSNRLPFTISEKKGFAPLITPSSGGLVSSIQSYLNSAKEQFIKPLWIGATTLNKEVYESQQQTGLIDHPSFDVKPVFIPSTLNDKYYNGFCNNLIWPLFHYFPSFAKFLDEHYQEYINANQLFCETVEEQYQPNDLIWIHDYHLMLLPQMLRKIFPKSSIGFFLHIPFPSFELFRILPGKWRRNVLNGILGADQIGFHTDDYVQHFLKSVRQVLGFENTFRSIIADKRKISVDKFPVSIDFTKFNSSAENHAVFTERNRIRKKFPDEKIIISVDRLDYSKGIINRLEAFDLFLENNPKYRGVAVYILILVPSRDLIPKYGENKMAIEILISKINGRFGNIDWTPIIYQYNCLDFTKLTGLYLAADVALITPIRDGMNLVAKEFIASRKDKRGVLILSETAGAASELADAILVNPTDREEISEAILKAIELPAKEQINRNDTMQCHLKNNDVVKWAEDFIAGLIKNKNQQKLMEINSVAPATVREIISEYNLSEKRLIFLDYDGTLTPLARFPESAIPGKKELDLLNSLCDDPKNTVVLISGRSKGVLESWFGHLAINLVAEHGGFSKTYKNTWEQFLIEKIIWKEKVIEIFNTFCEKCPGAFIEEKDFSVVWHYRNSEDGLSFLRSRELINALTELSFDLGFKITEGNKIIEVRTHGIDKGTTAKKWLDEDKYDFILAIGDDNTDEDLFQVIPEGHHSFRIGLQPSLARYHFNNQEEASCFLRAMISKNI